MLLSERIGRKSMNWSSVAVFSAVFFLLGLFFVQFAWSAHMVGEPELEKLPIWQQCCEQQDCVPETVKTMGKENKGMIPVNIDGVNASVGKEKFTAVPSPHTWVCYYNPNGEITDDNIRCILYPQHTVTTKAWERNR